ncbi:tRNA pseudouridine(38/39) synthase [Drosophila tropicalis]|uniref:tRNA pseudouridine(38/39) synthase n=1 Tax=Drosophila tropicalis TaxID=46794 RepID=UPI0035AB881F
MGDGKKVVINKRLKGLPREELEKLSKPELIDQIVRLEAYNFQLKSLLQKKLNEKTTDPGSRKMWEQDIASIEASTAKDTSSINNVPSGSKSNKRQRTFDWASAHKRHVLLKVTYFGWDYQGFACQEDSNDTIESNLFRALTRTCLIESRANSNYHRCGRTDKEVSAFCQVISIDLRSKYPAESQLDPTSLETEIDYCGLLNRVLPKNIQCVAWMPLRSPVYSARFDCIARSYRYYFPKGDLDIDAMQEACQLLVKHADFRNFCKMDVHNGVTSFMRNLQAARVQPCEETLNEKDSGYDMFYLEIKANAFLWHQIRCIMAILLLVGQRKEKPSIISNLLDINVNPCKPQYTPAIGLPLNLFHCEFREHTTRRTTDDEGDEVLIDDNFTEVLPAETHLTDWIYNEENLTKLIENIQGEWTQFSVKCTMIRNVLQQLEELLSRTYQSAKPVQSQVYLLQDSVKPRQYQPLLERTRCESLENRIEHFVKKQRLIVQET